MINTVSNTELLMTDPAILNIALGLHEPFFFLLEHPKRDVANEFCNLYVRKCVEDRRLPVSINPAEVRGALETLMKKWNYLLKGN